MLPMRAMGRPAAMPIASFRSRASTNTKPAEVLDVSANGPMVVDTGPLAHPDRGGRVDRLERLGDDQVAAQPELLVVRERRRRRASRTRSGVMAAIRDSSR